tara:strand:+ start:494 stop:841 length:348 start_codon:yes stop_codon:yes gene_type:complete
MGNKLMTVINSDIAHAILAIKSDAWTSINAEDINQITWHDGNPTNITKEQILTKQAELKAAHDAIQHQRDRTKFQGINTYPSMGDQLDMMWHDKKNGTTTWEDAIEAVKNAHPKP